jgi:chromosome segregation ATPase
MSPNQYYSVAEYHKVAKARLTEINNDLKLIPARIDEAQKAMPEEFDGTDLEREIALLTVEKQKLTDKLNSSQSEKLSDIRQQIAELKISLLDKESEHKKKYNNINNDINEQIKGVNSKKNVSQATIDRLNSDTIRFEIDLKSLNRMREQLLQEHSVVSKSTWTGDTLCPTCGQPLPEEQIQATKEQFNFNRSKNLEEINQRGKNTCSKEMIANLEKRFSDGKETIEREKAKIVGYVTEIEDLENKLTAAPPFNESAEYKEINDKISLLCSQMDGIKNTENTIQKALQIQIDDINSKINESLSKRSKLDLIKTQKERIAELEKQEKKLGEEYEKTSKGIYLCELFIRTKVSMLTDSINNRFNSVKFRLFETQINGGVKETCDVLVPCSNGLVPYPYANNAAKINAGLDIIRVLSEHYGVKIPVFVDNAESVTQLNDADLQVIKLIVSENDKKLRMEV